MDLETSLVPEKKRVVTSFEIGDLKPAWDAYCSAHGVSSGEALCQVIQKLTGASFDAVPQGAKPPGLVGQSQSPYDTSEGVEKRRARLYLSLSESEKQAVEERARADGFTKGTAWAVALIRARLTSEPQFGFREVEVLGESNHQLLAIGRNLNQIAHAMNAARLNPNAQYDADLVQNLADAVKKHVKKVGDALRASVNRWTLE